MISKTKFKNGKVQVQEERDRIGEILDNQKKIFEFLEGILKIVSVDGLWREAQRPLKVTMVSYPERGYSIYE